MNDIALSHVLRGLWSVVPSGGSLPEDVWLQRRRFLLGLTWFHAIIIALVGPVLGYRWELSLAALFREDTILHTVGEGSIVAVFAALASWKRTSRSFQATAIGLGLMSSSAILVHLSGGYIELHFHFFVMLAFLALFQDWIPYILSIVYVAIHHGVVGVLWPQGVYNHTAAFNAPWTWAGIHAFFVLAAAVGSIIAWRFNEEASARTTLLLESVGEGIYGLDLKGNITFINPAAAKMLRWDVRTAVGQPMHQIVRHTRDDGTPFPDGTSPIHASLKDGSACSATDDLFWAIDGTSFPVEYVSTPIIDRGRLIGVVVTFKDVTERKQAADNIRHLNETLERRVSERAAQLDELQRAQTRLIQSEKLAAMGTLLAGVAHELNNPLTILIGGTTVLRQAVGSEPLARRVDTIRVAAERCARIVKNFLALARQQPTEQREVALDQVVREAVELLSYPLRVDNVEVTHVAGDLPLLWADPNQLHQVVVNLITNAHQAMRTTPTPRRLTLTTRFDPERRTVALEVADTGPGIPPEIQARIFDPFFTTKAPGQGTGLGLSLCLGIVERHGGSIRLESRPGQGAIFRIELPVQAPAVAASEAPLGEAPASVPGRILVVDDEPEVAMLLADILAADGHQVETVGNGALALARLEGRAYDLILSDVRMPELDGPDLYREVERRYPELCRKFVLITGDVLSPETAKFLERTGAPNLAKPFFPDEVRRAVQHALSRSAR